MENKSQSVVFQVLGTASGKAIGIATLNIEKALNALNMEMVELLMAQLKTWQQDDNIACVMLDGSGDKAFCAGGDVRALHSSASLSPGEIPQMASEFFEKEYRLDYLLHTYGKPVLVWGDGIVMGGGLGLMAGASHRVVTQTSRIAMPEVTIGLYPDVGGSYFLNRMPGKTGLFLGMTAYNLNAADALYVGLGNHYVDSGDKEPLLNAMAELPWSSDEAQNKLVLTTLLNNIGVDADKLVSDSPLKQNQELIDELMTGDTQTILANMQSITDEQLEAHSWLGRARKTMLAGSPISWQLVYEQSLLGTELSLAQVFYKELGMSVLCCAIGDFREGVRALLLDKDRQPKWLAPNLEELSTGVNEDLVERILTSPWSEAEHPLRDLI